MRISNRYNTKRMLALAFLLCFLLAALLSEAFLLARANHEHDHFGAGGSCATCAQIQNIENQRRRSDAAASGLSAVWIGLFAAAALLCCVSLSQFLTPVLLKTRLNN